MNRLQDIGNITKNFCNTHKKGLIKTAAGVFTAGVFATAAFADTGTTTASLLNVRAETSTSSAVVGQIQKGTEVEILGKYGDWYAINYKGKTAYLNAEYVTVASASVGNATGTVTGSYVFVRKYASTASTALTKLAQGTVVEILGYENGWYQVKYNGYTGYMSGDYISTESQLVPETPVVTNDPAEDPAPETNATVTGSAVYVRSKASTSGAILAKLYKGTKVTVLSVTDGWYKIQYGTITGFMSADYVKKDSGNQDPTTEVNEAGYVTGSRVFVRSKPSTSGTIITSYAKGTEITITGETDGWYRIKKGSVSGYMSAEYVTKDRTLVGVVADPVSKQLVDYALSFRGVPYVYGGADPSGFDCSGFTSYVYKHFGYTINRNSAAQYSNGTYVSKSDLCPGDLVFFSRSVGGSIGHVGIYIGNGQMIHSPSPGGVVCVVDLNSSYYVSHYVGARRII